MAEPVPLFRVGAGKCNSNEMNILFCSRTPLSTQLGASKIIIELAEEMQKLGWRCTLVSPEEVNAANGSTKLPYHEQLRRYLVENSSKFDVVDYDHGHLPYARQEFAADTLFVARSVLLAHHFKHILIPSDKNLKERMRSLVLRSRSIKQRDSRIRQAQTTVKEADLVNVLNSDDQEELVRNGIPEEKIVVIPAGISLTRRAIFDLITEEPTDPVVVSIGTFDNRKGALDFPHVFQRIERVVRNVRFLLLGTYKCQDDVRRRFPRSLRERIDVMADFSPEELPGILAQCSLGLFPSYLEGFGLGVLEMLAAAVPVLAYRCPGPPVMLSDEFLVSPGNWRDMSDRAIGLLTDREKLLDAREWARKRSREFMWDRIARKTSDIYIARLKQSLARNQS